MRDTIEMAREAGIYHAFDSEGHWDGLTNEKLIERNPHPNDIVYGEKRTVEILKAFEALVRADERARMAEQPAQRCPLCNYQHGHAIGCKNNPVDIALNKMAENARELGLDYEPLTGTQISKVWWDGDKLMAKPIPLESIYKEPEQPARQEPVAEYIGECSDGSLVQLYDDVKKGTKFYTSPQPAPVLPDPLTYEEPETREYINGWNDCRQAMLESLRKPT